MPTVIDWIKKAASKRSIDNRPGVTGGVDAAPAAANDVAQRYANLGEIARGGMGAILKAFDPDLRRTLAMKVALERGAAPVERESKQRHCAWKCRRR